MADSPPPLSAASISVHSSESISSTSSSIVPLHIDRYALHQEEFDRQYGYYKPRTKLPISWPKVSRNSCIRLAKSLFPPLEWIPQYRLSYLLSDLIAGATVSVLNVPQAMAYASLANVPPVIGLYTSFFSTIFYALLGTSKHVVLGMFAVVALMVGDILRQHSQSYVTNGNSTSFTEDDAIRYVSAITFTSGIIFCAMAIAQLHVMSAYLATHLVSGFTTGAAVHVLASQLPKLISIDIPEHSGLFKLYHVAVEFFGKCDQANLADLTTSVIAISVLMIGKYWLNPWMSTRCKVPVPMELIVIIAATTSSYFFSFDTRFGTKVVGKIPVGIPPPRLPDVTLVPEVFVESIPVAIVAFGVTLSVGKLFARKHSYKINPTQELRAMALIHVLTSFVSCHPSSAGLSRCVVVSQLGSKSAIAATTSAVVVLLVMLWLGPHLYSLPKCVLASIIVVALQAMFLQAKDLPRLWRTSKVDFAIWMVSFLITVLWDVSQGLIGGILFALFTVVLRTQFAKSVSLGQIPATELYKDETIYTKALQMEKMVVLRFDSPLLFVNCDRFIQRTIKFVLSKPPGAVRHLIVDASGFTQVDQMGVESLKDLHVELKKEGVQVVFASAKAPVRDLFEVCRLYEIVPKRLFFPSLHDAVVHLNAKYEEERQPQK